MAFFNDIISGLQQSSLLNFGMAVVAITVTGFYFQVWTKKKVPKTLIDPDVKYPLKLLRKEIISHDTR